MAAVATAANSNKRRSVRSKIGTFSSLHLVHCGDLEIVDLDFEKRGRMARIWTAG